MPVKQPPVVEAEVLDESGRVISTRPCEQDHARPQGDMTGVLSGVLVLIVGFVATAAVIIFGLFVVCPLLLLGRLCGLPIRVKKP